MTCEHNRTEVLHSRKPDSLNASGQHWYGKRQYSVFAFRRRRCLDCGLRFTTVEIDLDTADNLANRSEVTRKELLKEIGNFLAQQVDGASSDAIVDGEHLP